LRAQVFEAAGKSSVHDDFKLGRELFAFRLSAGGTQLQVLGRHAVVARLRRLQKSEDRSGGRAAP
jgi:hypothetical protein